MVGHVFGRFHHVHGQARDLVGQIADDVIKGKLLESELLMQQAANNTKEQFANSPDLTNGILYAIMDALAAHSTMSKQALESEKLRSGLKDVLLGPAQLYESLRAKGVSSRQDVVR
jgi:type I restriction enzyme R subunit